MLHYKEKSFKSDNLQWHISAISYCGSGCQAMESSTLSLEIYNIILRQIGGQLPGLDGELLG